MAWLTIGPTAGLTIGPTAGRQVVLLSQALHDLLAARFAIHDHLVQERALRLEAVDLGLATLRRVGEQDELLDTVCRWWSSTAASTA